jgi:hypothetical protein
LAKIWQQVGEKPEETIDCRKLKKNKKGVLKSHTPLTSSHDDVIKNKKFREIKLTVLVVPSTQYRRFFPIFHQIDSLEHPDIRV